MNRQFRPFEEYNTDSPQRSQGAPGLDAVLPLYEAPSVLSYTDQEILDQLGPAQTVNYGSTQTLVGGIGG